MSSAKATVTTPDEYMKKIKSEYFMAGIKRPVLDLFIESKKPVYGALVFTKIAESEKKNFNGGETALYYMDIKTVNNFYKNDANMQAPIKLYLEKCAENKGKNWYFFIFEVQDEINTKKSMRTCTVQDSLDK